MDTESLRCGTWFSDFLHETCIARSCHGSGG